VIVESWVEATRHVRSMLRNSELLAFAAVQPIMFVLLFVYILGGSIAVEGFDRYEQYLIPGILAQGVVFSTSFTSVGLAEDLTRGFVDRLRSLPIRTASILVGRTISDLLRNAGVLAATIAVAFLVGFRFEGSLIDALSATLLLLVFSYSMSWIQTWIGMSVNTAEAANSAGLIWMFPLTFVSSAYVDPATMPSWMRPFAEHNPFTVLTNAIRALYNGNDPGRDWWLALVWAAGIAAVFAAISANRFARMTRA
jgi:ABC-2 type transport system permease protein